MYIQQCLLNLLTSLQINHSGHVELDHVLSLVFSERSLAQVKSFLTDPSAED